MSFQKLEFVKGIDQRAYSLLIEDYGETSYSHFSSLVNKIIEFLFEYYFDTIGEVYSESDILKYRDFLKSTRKDALIIKNEIFKLSLTDCDQLYKLASLRGKVPERNDLRKSLLILHKVLLNCYEYEKHERIETSYEDFFRDIGATDLIIETIEKEVIVAPNPVKPSVAKVETKAPVESVVAKKDKEPASLTTAKQRQKKKKGMDFHSVVTLIQLISMFAFAAAGFTNPYVMWPFFIVTGLVLISIILYQGLLCYPPKREKVSGIIILCVISISWLTLSGLHIGRAAAAESNYLELQNQIQNVRYSSDPYYIKKTIKRIPLTYKDVREIREEADDLEWIFDKKTGRDQFGKVNNFHIEHPRWDCSEFLYNFGIKTLLIDAEWTVDSTSKTFSYYRESGQEWISVPSILPNNKKSGQTYYFYTTFGYFNDDDHLVNQYIEFGYENKNDNTDKFLAYKFSNYHFNNSGKRIMDVYCYSDNSSHTLTYSKDIKM